MYLTICERSRFSTVLTSRSLAPDHSQLTVDRFELMRRKRIRPGALFSAGGIRVPPSRRDGAGVRDGAAFSRHRRRFVHVRRGVAWDSSLFLHQLTPIGLKGRKSCEGVIDVA